MNQALLSYAEIKRRQALKAPAPQEIIEFLGWYDPKAEWFNVTELAKREFARVAEKHGLVLADIRVEPAPDRDIFQGDPKGFVKPEWFEVFIATARVTAIRMIPCNLPTSGFIFE